MSKELVVAEGSRSAARKSKGVNLVPSPLVPLQSELDGNGDSAREDVASIQRNADLPESSKLVKKKKKKTSKKHPATGDITPLVPGQDDGDGSSSKEDATSIKIEVEKPGLCETMMKKRRRDSRKISDDKCHSHATEDISPLPSSKVPVQSEFDGNSKSGKEDATSKIEGGFSASHETMHKKRKKKNSNKLPDDNRHSHAIADISPLTSPKVPVHSEVDRNGNGAKEDGTSSKREVDLLDSIEVVKTKKRRKKNDKKLLDDNCHSRLPEDITPLANSTVLLHSELDGNSNSAKEDATSIKQEIEQPGSRETVKKKRKDSKKIPDDKCHSCASEDISPLASSKVCVHSEVDGNGAKEDVTLSKREVDFSDSIEIVKTKKRKKKNDKKILDDNCQSRSTEDITLLTNSTVPLQFELDGNGKSTKEDATSLKRKSESRESCGKMKEKKRKISKKSADEMTEMTDTGLQSSEVVSSILEVKPVEDTLLMDNLKTPINDMGNNGSKEKLVDVETINLHSKKRKKRKNEEEKQEGVHPYTSDQDHQLNTSLLVDQNAVSLNRASVDNAKTLAIQDEERETGSQEIKARKKKKNKRQEMVSSDCTPHFEHALNISMQESGNAISNCNLILAESSVNLNRGNILAPSLVCGGRVTKVIKTYKRKNRKKEEMDKETLPPDGKAGTDSGRATKVLKTYKRKNRKKEEMNKETLPPSYGKSGMDSGLISSIHANQNDIMIPSVDALVTSVDHDNKLVFPVQEKKSELKTCVCASPIDKHTSFSKEDKDYNDSLKLRNDRSLDQIITKDDLDTHVKDSSHVGTSIHSLTDAHDPKFQDGVMNKQVLVEGNSLDDKQTGDGFLPRIAKENEIPLIEEPMALGKLNTVPQKKLLVLDLNGVLADVLFTPKQDSNREYILISGKSVFKRPYCDEFLKFCFETFDVGVWSSRRQYNIEPALRFLMGDRRHDLIFCWDQMKCTFTGYNTIENQQKPLVLKELDLLWNSEKTVMPWEKGRYSPSNTLLIDDSPYKAICNPPHTAIFPHPYDYQNLEDNSLGQGGDLRVYLEGLAAADDVQEYVEKHPFGQKAITEKDGSWLYYKGIIDKINSRKV